MIAYVSASHPYIASVGSVLKVSKASARNKQLTYPEFMMHLRSSLLIVDLYGPAIIYIIIVSKTWSMGSSSAFLNVGTYTGCASSRII